MNQYQKQMLRDIALECYLNNLKTKKTKEEYLRSLTKFWELKTKDAEINNQFYVTVYCLQKKMETLIELQGLIK